MSASLVGSEMCIRDRGEALPWGKVARGCRPPRACRPPPAPARGRGRPLAVSYTHLTLPTICSV
eukprot:14793974-Alexandrium_andersonii.AAC.1